MTAEPDVETVHVEIDRAICVITIDRPYARNAVDGPTAAALVEASPESPLAGSLGLRMRRRRRLQR